MNAMRSRCCGSMFAWILKTKPVSLPSLASTSRCTVSCLQRRGRVRREMRQQLLDAEVGDGRAEEHRRLFARAIVVHVEFRGAAAHQLDLVVETRGAVAEEFATFGAVQSLDHAIGAALAASRRLVDVDLVFDEVIDAGEIAAHADGPGHRRGADLEHALDFIEQLDGRPALAIELVDEGHDRRVAHAAHLHQLDGSLFDTLGAVDDHERAVYRRERAIRVLGEVLVAGRVEQVDDAGRGTGTASPRR